MLCKVSDDVGGCCRLTSLMFGLVLAQAHFANTLGHQVGLLAGADFIQTSYGLQALVHSVHCLVRLNLSY